LDLSKVERLRVRYFYWGCERKSLMTLESMSRTMLEGPRELSKRRVRQ